MQLVIRVARLLPERMLHQVILRTNLVRKAMTLGVRVLVEDAGGNILLVRHSYIPGWYFPGGAVDSGESMEAAAIRELREETGLLATGRPELMGIYRSLAGPGRDHIAVYRVTSFSGVPTAGADGEIAELGFFPHGKLPQNLNPSIQQRIAEIFDGAQISETW